MTTLKILGISALLLIIPFTFTYVFDAMDWGVFDFVLVWVLLSATGLIFKMLTRDKSNLLFKLASALAVGTGLLLIWANLAVGIIGNENNPANLMYFGVIAVALIGLLVSKLKTNLLARTLFVTALAQMLVPLIAFIIWRPDVNIGLVQVLGINLFFAVLWSTSAILFHLSNPTVLSETN